VLQAAGAQLATRTLPAGHNLTQDDLIIAKNWLEHLP
jgi:predicted esterase